MLWLTEALRISKQLKFKHHNYSIIMNSQYAKGPPEQRDIHFTGRVFKSNRTNSNSVSLSRYKWHNILSTLLIEQFSRPVNSWLLLISLIQLSTSYEERHFLFITLLPFCLMLLLSIVRDLLSTYRKYQYDVKVNNAPTKVWDGTVFKEINTADLTVGDFVVLYNKERVPADMILLCIGSSENKCFVDTSAILDDKDLMTKFPIESIRFQLGFENLSEVAFKLKHIKGTATVPQPNADFSNFEGKIKLKVAPVASNVKMKNFLLRDSKIMNTNWVIGLVVYTGNETKAWINSLSIPRKTSSIEKLLNKITLFLLGIITLFSCISLILSRFKGTEAAFENPGKTFFHFLLLYSILVPSPVYILIDVIKLLRVLKLQKNSSITFRNTNILEDLGRVEYILADKTGTLTERDINVSMCIFKNFYFKNIEDLVEIETSPAMDLETKSDREEYTNKYNYTDKEHFVMCLAVCNKGITNDYGETYLTKSGDERVLISTATILGLKLVKRKNKSLTILKDGHESKFKILGSQSMSKKRSKGHIVLQTLDKSKTILYIIGNFEPMDELINFVEKQDLNILETVKSNKKSGIRQLILAYKELSSTEAEQFSAAFQKASRSPINKQGRTESLFDEIDVNSIYLGLVGLEEAVDLETRLAVTAFKNAGIKIWMLSGDSFESSLSAGFGSGIVEDNFPIVSIHDVKSEDEFLQISESLLEKYLAGDKEFQKVGLRRSSLAVYQEQPGVINSEFSMINSNNNTPAQTRTLRNGFSMIHTNSNRNIITDDFGARFSSRMSNSNEFLLRGKNIHPLVRKITNAKSNVSSFSNIKITEKFSRFSLFVDSKSLEFGLKSNDNLKNLVLLLFCANSVCFTSLLPSHKTKIVKILQKNFSFNPLVLAVGDGGSDVGMIKSAGIGVGLFNDEGNQAASASDIVINDFSDLKSLILEEGLKTRANLKISAALGIYSLFYLMSLLFLLNLVCDFSGPVFIPIPWYISFYLVFSVLGIMTIGLFDNEISVTRLEHDAKVYMLEALNQDLILKSACFCILGFLQAGVSVFILYFGVQGYWENISSDGLLLYIVLIVSVNLFHSLFIRNLNKWTLFGPILNLTLSILMVLIQSYTDVASDNYFVPTNFAKTGILVIHTILCILFQTLIVLTFRVLKIWLKPSPLDTYKDVKVFGDFTETNSRLLKFANDISKVYRTREEYDKSLSIAADFSPLSLKFKINSREKKYQEYSIPARKKNFYSFLITFGVLTTILLLVSVFYNELFVPVVASLSIVTIVVYMCTVIYWFLRKSTQVFFLFKFIYLTLNILVGISAILLRSPPSLIIIYPSTFLLFLTEDWLTMLAASAINSILLFRSTTLYLMADLSGRDLYIAVAQFIGIYSISTVTCTFTTYLLKKQNLLKFKLLQKVKDDYEKVTSVLYYLLPGFVRKRVNEGCRYIAEDQGEVSVLFCYIVGFDKITAEYSIEELTALLDEIFGKIDSLCELIGVSKIETVANTYMACAGLKDSEDELKPSLRSIHHARRAIELGFAILRDAGKIYLKSGEKITLKIGVHSGKVTAGVVGYHKPQFSLVGDTVNTASRMASNAKVNTILVSDITYDLVGDHKNFIYSKNEIEIKGKGLMVTYTISLNQMKNLDNFIEHRISLSHASMGSAGLNSFAEGDSLDEVHKTNDFLDNFDLFRDTEFFENEQGEGYIEQMKFFNLGLKEGKEMAEFRMNFLKTYFWIYFIGGVMKILCVLILLVTYFVEYNSEDAYISAGLVLELVVLALILVFLVRNRGTVKYNFYLACIYFLVLFLSITASLKYPSSQIVTMYVLIHFQLMFCCTGLFFSQIFIPTLVLALYWLSVLIYNKNETLSQVFPISVYFIAIQALTLFYWEKQIRVQNNISIFTKSELNKTETLLTQMIPKHVYDHLKDENTVTDHFFQVTIIYADIVGFTPWSSGREAKEIVNMLSSLFTKFDKSSVKNNIYKVHTIGDCYVAMGYHGGVNRSPAEECVNMIKFAYSMIKIIKKVQEQNKELNMRIGLHTGEVIGGVMGTSIVRYDIYGADVLIANQMESNGIPGKIMISETTRSYLEKARPKMFDYKFHTEVKALERVCKAYELIKVSEFE